MMKRNVKIIHNKIRLLFNHCMRSTQFGKVGKGTWIGRPLRVVNGKHVSIGNNCWILKNLRIEAISSWGDQVYSPSITICDNVSIQQNVHITCAEKIVIGEGTCILANCCITDIKHNYLKVDLSPNVQPITHSSVSIGKNCLLGFGSVVFPGVELGNNVIVGANSIVTHSFPSYSVVVGNPARIIKQYSFSKGTWENV